MRWPASSPRPFDTARCATMSRWRSTAPGTCSLPAANLISCVAVASRQKRKVPCVCSSILITSLLERFVRKENWGAEAHHTNDRAGTRGPVDHIPVHAHQDSRRKQKREADRAAEQQCTCKPFLFLLAPERMVL